MLGSRTGRTTSVASALLLTSALLPLLAGCAPTAGSAPIRLDDGVVADDAAATTFTVPIGTVTVAVGVPRDHLDADDVLDAAFTDDDGVSAPDGGALVPVRTEFSTDDVPWGGLLGVAGVSPARITLVSGEDEVAVPEPYQVVLEGRGTSGSAVATWAVVVPDGTDPDDLEVRVEYDGGTQEAAPGSTPTGAASVLSRLAPARRAPMACGPWDVDRPRWRVDVRCDIGVPGWTPYWPGRGWAPPGSAWLVLRVGYVEVEQLRDPAGRPVTVGAQRWTGALTGAGADRFVTLARRDVPAAGLPLGIVVVADPIGGPSDTVTVDLTLPAPPVPAALG